MIRKAYHFLQLLSIDVTVGACITSYMVAEILGIGLPFIIYFSLGASVWLTYTMDHLLDANSNTKAVVTPRHRFHKQYFHRLTYLWLLVLIITTVASLKYLPIQTIYFGIAAVVLVIMHLVLVKLLGNKVSIYIQKELGIALTYSLGVVVGPLSMMKTFPSYMFLVVGQLFVLAFINLIEFSYFEVEEDTKQGQSSLVHNIGELNVKRLLYVLISVGGFLNLYSFFTYPDQMLFQILLGVMYLVLVSILWYKKYFEQQERYRLWGDAIFLFPVILFLF